MIIEHLLDDKDEHTGFIHFFDSSQVEEDQSCRGMPRFGLRQDHRRLRERKTQSHSLRRDSHLVPEDPLTKISFNPCALKTRGFPWAWLVMKEEPQVAYMTHDRSVPVEELLHLVSTIPAKILFIGCGGNTRRMLWGRSENSEGGESLFDFLINTNLLLRNRDNRPTIHFPSSKNCHDWKVVLDVTLLTENGILSVKTGECADHRSCTDHSCMFFSV